jgi:outer membrane lipoprotein-sorting protein
MRRALNIPAWIVIYFLLVTGIHSVENKVPAMELVKRMDELYRSSASEATMEMEIVTPHWTRTLKMKFWSLGMEKSFIRILAPKKERGIATLKLGNEMWNFLPKTDKVMKIPPSMMMGSWMGSDFTNDDLVKEYTFLDDYTFEYIDFKDSEEGQLYVKCIPKKDRPIIWGHIIIAIFEKDHMPKWQRYFDEKGTLVREMLFRDVKMFGKKSIPAVMELVNLKKKGQKTTIRYLDANFNIKINKGIFSLRNLRARE